MDLFRAVNMIPAWSISDLKHEYRWLLYMFSSCMVYSLYKIVSRTLIQPYIKEILGPLQYLLVLIPPENGSSLISEDDQLYLYEAAAVMIVSGAFGAQVLHTSFRSLTLNCCMFQGDITLFVYLCTTTFHWEISGKKSNAVFLPLTFIHRFLVEGDSESCAQISGSCWDNSELKI
jgi:hypothetical protein